MTTNSVPTAEDSWEDVTTATRLPPIPSTRHTRQAAINNVIRSPQQQPDIRVVLRLAGFQPLDHHTVYFVSVSDENDSGRTWFVRKRFSQFDQLRKDLKQETGTRMFKLPPKEWPMVKNLTAEFSRARARGLSTFLWSVAGSEICCRTKALHDFLFSDVVGNNAPQTMEPATPFLRGGIGGGGGPNIQQSLASLAAAAATSSSATTTPNNPQDEFFLDPTRRSQRDSSVTAPSHGSSIGSEPSLLGLFPIQSGTTATQLTRVFQEEGLGDMSEDTMRHASASSSNVATNGSGNSSLLNVNDSDDAQSFSSSFREKCTFWPSRVNDNDDPISSSSHPNKQKDAMSSSTSSDWLFVPDNVAVPVPSLRIVIILVGSRGDVQPYVALGKALTKHGHRVRIAAHECFREWVTKSHGLDFAKIAGDPKELLRMVVENNMFSYNFVKTGLTTHRTWVSNVLDDAWNACTQEDPDHPIPYVSDGQVHGPGAAFAAMQSSYRADLVICNPPSFAGWHIAEALGIPLLLSFPMPWSRTIEFPSPFTQLGATSSAQLNWLTYGAVDRLIWLGIGDLVNKWRVEKLSIHPIWTMSMKGHRYAHDYKVPFLYPWSPAVLPQPSDWESHIYVSGYWFLEDSDGKEWVPSTKLAEFLQPDLYETIFIGFGSIVVADPERLSRIISDTAARLTIDPTSRRRVIIQKGWTSVTVHVQSDRVLEIGPAPHHYIFQRVACVVHHGGAGTTAEGLKAGTPTVIVPFFGDQFFWGQTVRDRKLGGSTSYAELTSESLVAMVEAALKPTVKVACMEVSRRMKLEDGLDNAVKFIEQRVFPVNAVMGHNTGLSTMALDGDGNGMLVDGDVDDQEWRSQPFYDLKKRIKIQRRENIRGFRKVKSRVKALLNGMGGSSTVVVGHTPMKGIGGQDEDLGVEMTSVSHDRVLGEEVFQPPTGLFLTKEGGGSSEQRDDAVSLLGDEFITKRTEETGNLVE